MQKIICFGELMLRLAPPGYQRFLQADSFEARFGGGEANVAVSLAHLGYPVSFVTKLPSHEMGQAAVNALRRYGVDTSFLLRGGERLGLYFLEKGASQRPSKVIYDRGNSSIRQAAREEFGWKEIFRGASWFHFTGITPALGDNIAEICLDACKAAKKAGLTVSCDLNYRRNLWSKEKARSIMSGLCEYVDVCIANEADIGDVFGIEPENSSILDGKLQPEDYRILAQKLCSRFPFQAVAITLRESLSASENNWSAMLWQKGQAIFSRKYHMHIVDRVGGGDSFAAALIAGLLDKMPLQDCIEFAAAASCLKHSIEGDFNLVSREEINRLMQGDGSGRVQR